MNSVLQTYNNYPLSLCRQFHGGRGLRRREGGPAPNDSGTNVKELTGFGVLLEKFELTALNGGERRV
jgi:hypothetical protein